MDNNSLNKLIEELLAMNKNSVTVKYGEADKDIPTAQSKFGGKPDVPANFRWPYYEGETYDDVCANRPLSFLAQINLSQINIQGGELPKTGVLSFFFEMETMKWGFDPKDKGCSRDKNPAVSKENGGILFCINYLLFFLLFFKSLYCLNDKTPPAMR